MNSDHSKVSFELDESRKKALFVISSGCTGAGILWGSLYFILGLKLSAILPLVFSVVVGLSLLYYKLTNQIKLLVFMQLFMILLIPTSLQWSLGGFHNSGVVILWGILAPFGALIFQSLFNAIIWIGVYLAVIAISIIFNQYFYVTFHSENITETVVLIFYGMNIICVSLVTFIAVYYFSENLYAEKNKQTQYLKMLNENVDKVIHNIEQFSQGKLHQQISLDTKDIALKRLEKGYNDSVKMFHGTFSEMKSSSGELTKVLGQVTNSLITLEKEVNDNSDNIQKIESHIDMITKDIEDLIRSISESVNSSQQNLLYAQKSSKVIQRTVAKIEEVSDSIQVTDELIGKLEISASQIDELISGINDIAESTNLLALNASIEAARAGEYGRGFSVVASEIGKLTSRTTEITKNINEKIKEIKKGINVSSQNFHSTVRLANEGREIASELSLTTEKIVTYSKSLEENMEAMEKKGNVQAEDLKKISASTLNLLNSLKEFLNNLDFLSRQSKSLETYTSKMQTSMNQFTIN